MTWKWLLRFIILAAFGLGLVFGLLAQAFVDAVASAYAGKPGTLIALCIGAIIGLVSFAWGWRVTGPKK